MDILKIVCILICFGRSWGQEQIYIISAAKVFHVGATENVVIQAYGYTEAFDATISMKSFPDKRFTYSSAKVNLSPENKFQNSASLIIQPRDLSKSGNPVLYVNLEVVSPHFTREKRIPLNYENGFLFIQTDKPVYTPDQSVKIRVYSLNEELKPARRETILTFIDPEGTEVEILQENDYIGIVSFPDFKIPSNPKYGVWTIKAKYKEDFITSGLTYFEIKEYVMPHFSILIEPENNFISYKEFEDFSITIKANYFYNKKVSEGEVYIYFGIKESLEDDRKEMMPKAMQQTQIINGITEVTFNSKKAIEELSYRSLEDLNNKYLYVAVTVLESAGGFYEETEVPGIKYVLSPYQLNLIATPLFVKPGIPFPIKVQVKDPLGQFVGGVMITLNAKAILENQEESQKEPQKSTTHQNNGVALFVVNLPSHVTALEFNIRTEDPNIAEENQAFKEYRAESYSSPSKSYLYIDWTENFKPLLVGDHLSITVKPKSPYIDKIAFYNYLVLSKGKIIHFGTREKLEHLSYQSLNIPVTQNMVPSARLLVYYLVTGENRAELVADSVWLDVEEKCGNNLQVQLSKNENVFTPGQSLSLNLVTQENSWVALSAMDMAVYGIKGNLKKPKDMKRVMQIFEKSDLGCGAGGGQDSADVFHLAGLTFLTNANAKDSQENVTPCKEILRPKRDLKEEIDKKAAEYKIQRIQKCCYEGAFKSHETCEQRLARIKKGKPCIQAFKSCCLLAAEIRAELKYKNIILGRMYFKTLMEIGKTEIRSYFPESWLWEVYNVRLRYRFPLTLPDSLTTWEIQAIGISDKGICVADPLQVKVMKDIFLEMHIPYSVVRGEQIQIKGTIYNYKSSDIKYCAYMSVDEGICLAGSSSSHHQGSKQTQCVLKNIGGSSIQLVTFTILPLELGLHTINFTLNTLHGKEILVKTLRVVPEGIKRESHAGFTLDPQGVYGSISRRKEFQFRIPLDIVPKTNIERTVSVKGALIGEVISAVLTPEGITTLSHLPKGSAEADLMSIIPIFYVYHYLETGNNWDILGASHVTEKENMKRKMKEGIVSILSYKNADYSYSMWKSKNASTWFTALALRIFGQVNKYIPQNRNLICNSLLWLIEKCQLENGSFKDDSDYQPLKLQGTLPKYAKEKAIYLTAFTLIGMRKSFEICPTEKINEAIVKAESFLLENALDAQSTFTLAISSYALALGIPFHPGSQAIFLKLKKEAFVKGNPPIYRFWKNDFKNKDSTVPSVATAQMVETTAYALLCSLLLNDMNYAKPIIKWLSEEQRYGGGFYSTQDTINAIEALTEHALLLRKLQLNMNIKVSYKHQGDFLQYKMTDQNSLAKPMEVPLNDDIIVSTGFSSGLATVHVKSVSHIIGTSKEICNFELRIESQDMEVDHYGRSSDSGDKLMIACASYKPSEEESSSGSSHAVMDIALPTGIGANTEDLSVLTDGVDQLLASYQIKRWACNYAASIQFLLMSSFVFDSGSLSFLKLDFVVPATFSVYEYHRPDKQCTIFYNLLQSKLGKVCEGSTCGCVEADCGQMKKELDLTISAEARKKAACQEDIAYAYKVKISDIAQENSFVKYTATILDVYKTGKALAQKNAVVVFIKKKTCTSTDIKKERQYLIMGKEALQIRYNYSFKYVYPLDSLTWIEYWPSDETCPSCKDFITNLEEFSVDIFLYGC